MTVVMNKHAYTKFLKFVIEHAHPYKSRHSWQEVIGFIFGRFSQESEESSFEVYITDVLPMDSGSSVYVKVGDYSTIYPILLEKMENGEFVVGWIHSHPGLGIFLSGTDINTQSIYQKMDSRSIAIVVDQTQIKNNNPGLKCFRITPDKYNYDTIPIEIENINDFTVEYNTIVNMIEPGLRLVKPQFSDFTIAKIGNIQLDVTAPKTWKKDEHFQIFVSYRTEEIGFVKIKYQPEMIGGLLNNKSTIFMNHKVYNSGIVAIFLVKNNPDVSQLMFSMKNIEIINKNKEKLTPEPVEIEINLN
jgi:proteasome lid subunit RPN8/RPN11